MALSNNVNNFIKWQVISWSLNITDLPSLYYRSIIGDLIFSLKLLNEHFKLDFSTFSLSPNTHTTGNSLKIYIPYTHVSVDQISLL